MDCPSRYTIDRRTGERLACDQQQDHLRQHTAKAYGHTWFWTTAEEDKESRNEESVTS